jgi:hypothetical protein
MPKEGRPFVETRIKVEILEEYICGPCRRGEHLLCEDNCDCECADKFDLPQSMTGRVYGQRA